MNHNPYTYETVLSVKIIQRNGKSSVYRISPNAIVAFDQFMAEIVGFVAAISLSPKPINDLTAYEKLINLCQSYCIEPADSNNIRQFHNLYTFLVTVDEKKNSKGIGIPAMFQNEGC